jgi:hypothetical protein
MAISFEQALIDVWRQTLVEKDRSKAVSQGEQARILPTGLYDVKIYLSQCK